MVAKTREERRLIRKNRVRKKVRGTSDRPRLCVYRSNKHIYSQIINDEEGVTLVAASTLDKEFDLSKTSNKEAARRVGKLVAQRALAKKIKKVVFDRNGFLYHGRVKELAEGAREGGLEF